MQPPDFYLPTPPAPPGLQWFHYRDNVPPIPDLGPQYADYVKLYDPNWRPKNYVPNNMDTVRSCHPDCITWLFITPSFCPLLCVSNRAWPFVFGPCNIIRMLECP